MKEYKFKVKLEFTNIGIEGNNKKHAIEKLKDLYRETYKIELKDDEIKVI